MRRLALMAIVAAGVFYAPLPLIAQKGGGQAPLIPVADLPDDSGGATAPSEPPLEVDPAEAPALVPPAEVNSGGGTSAPAPGPAPPPAAPAPAPAPAEPSGTPALSPTSTPPPVTPAQATEEPETPVDETPEEEPTEPTTPDEDETDPEEFEQEFEGGPEPGQPESPAVTVPEATAGPQLPRTGPEVPAILLSGLSLAAAGMSLRALVRGRG